MQDKDFDNRIANLLRNRELETSKDAWERLEANLPKKQKKNFILWIGSVAAILILGLIWILQSENEENTITEVEPKIELPNKTDIIRTENITKVVSNETSSNPTTIESNPKISTQKVSKEVNQNNLLTIQEENKPEIPQKIHEMQNIQNESELAEIDINALVMSKLKSNKTQYTINPEELLQLAESEINAKKDKNLKEKVIEKVKHTVNDIQLAFN